MIRAERMRHSLPNPYLAVGWGVVLALLASCVGSSEAQRRRSGEPEAAYRQPPPDIESDIKADEEVILFTSVGRCNREVCELPIHGWIYEPEEDSILRRSVVSAMREVVTVKPEQEKSFAQRLAWFLVDNERGKDVYVRSGSVYQRMGESGANGHFKGRMVIPRPRDRSTVKVEAVTRDGDSRQFSGNVLLLEEEGLSVISDIDDTIKVTECASKERTLQRTFLEPFEEVPGQAARYREWQKTGAAFHYLSASPWQLYIPLRSFLYNQKFPDGSMHLQKFRAKDLDALNLLKSPATFKRKRIETFFHQYPKRRFILVGDSGQADPEVYTEFAQKYPGQVEAIYIREIYEGHMSQARLAKLHETMKLRIQLL